MGIPLPILMVNKDLTALEACYWGFQSLTTIGYGDVSLDSDELKMFATIYTSVGMMGVLYLKYIFLDRAYARVSEGKKKIQQIKVLCIASALLVFILAVFTAYWGP